MSARRLNGGETDAVADSAAGHVHPLRLPLARVVQLVALALVAWTCGAALGSLPTVGALAFSEDGKILVGAVNGDPWRKLSHLLHSRGTVRVWDAASGEARATLGGPATWLRSISISSHSSTLAVAGDSPSIELWDIGHGIRSCVLDGHEKNVDEVAFAPSGEILASANSDGKVRLWNIVTKTSPLAVAVDRGRAHDLCFTPDGQTLVAADSNGVRFWCTGDGRLLNEIHGERLGFLGFTEGGKDFLLVRNDSSHGHLKTVLDGFTQAERFAVRSFTRVGPRLSPDGRTIAFGDSSGSVSILAAVSGRALVKAVGLISDVRCLEFSPDGKLLAAGDEGGTVCVWDAGTGRLRSRFSCCNLARHWAPTMAAIAVLGLATLRLRRPGRGISAAPGSRFWNGIRRMLFGRISTSTQTGGAGSVVLEGQLLSRVHTLPKREPMWDAWLDG